MADAQKLVESMKRAALGAVEAAGPVAVLFGVVESTSPLRIHVEQKMTLEESQLILTRAVTEYTVEMTVDHQTGDETEHTHRVADTYTGGGTSYPTSHRHGYTGRKTFAVHNGLVEGERVVLVRLQGGQQFLVLDRLGAME